MSNSKYQDLQVVLLAGGLGTRIREETESRPKPMIEIGGRPLLWHLMKYFSTFGLSDFVICTGYKAEVIVDYFTNFNLHNNDFTIDMSSHNSVTVHNSNFQEPWKVTIAHTGGPNVGTGGRLNRVRKYVKSDNFICTYGDGLSDIQIPILIKAHLKNGGVATVTVTKPTNRFGVVEMDNALVTSFREKPQAEGWINSGYFVFNQKIWDYLDDECTLEESPMKRLSKEGSLFGYEHLGFWQAMDTYREYQLLEGLWAENRAPWRIW